MTDIETPPSLDDLPSYGCDWGNCSDEVVAWRWADDLGKWLPVCSTHITPWQLLRPTVTDDKPSFVSDLVRIQTQEAEIERLRAWKAEATAVIDKWELAYDLIVPAGYARLGVFKQTELVNYVNARMSASAQQRIGHADEEADRG